MTDQEKRIKVAEICGWTNLEIKLSTFACDGKTMNAYGTNPATGSYRCVPLYHYNLNAMAEAEKVLTDEQWHDYRNWLRVICAVRPDVPERTLISATAAQRFDAFGKTLNLW
jgi:hypothetical protein